MDKNTYAILILAAGSSERLGRPKQLVDWKCSTLLNHTIGQAQKVDGVDVFVALGGNKVKILPSIIHRVHLLDVEDWSMGMGTTISQSIQHIDTTKYEGIILSVCDQPFISQKIFEALIAEIEKGKSSIVVSKYSSASGPPSLFSKIHFTELSQLTGDEGAKCMVQKYKSNVSCISFDLGNIDIDTERDVEKLTFLSMKEG